MTRRSVSRYPLTCYSRRTTSGTTCPAPRGCARLPPPTSSSTTHFPRRDRPGPATSRPPTRRSTSCTARRGLGKAYLAGFAIALERATTPPDEMSADGSPPRAAPVAAGRVGEADLVIGARWVKGGEVRNWPARGARALGRRQPLHQGAAGDVGQRRRRATASTARVRCGPWAFRASSRQGYCFQIDLTLRAVRAGLTVVEVPITFVEREVGVSKMGQTSCARR